ncbi:MULTISPECIES: UDP-glucose 4-epimerase GalE [Microbacterium]|uniref:UDP-glucose 4-epimerase n=1 Tax=Microbacterium oxydans TaxID=82380 RepID=A0A3Q9J7E8_9MICO|nr:MULTISPECIES: UDP-glucose 4-epimerase GalE [Microbacterium]AZS41007.1 UDP-glucose 4-epimerase [Microbacterium oxydans]KKX96228.1 UDP-glucose 4-epimerase [Microbacterium sp. Ag1]
MKVLITGGAGYIGSTVATACIEAGIDVVILDDLSKGLRAFCEGRAFYEGDIADQVVLERLLADHPDIDAVIHCAARIVVPESVTDPLGYYETNVGKTIVLLQHLRDAGIPRIVFSSSAAVYEGESGAGVDEDAPLAPSSPYATTKAMVEQILEDAASNGDFRAIALRYFNPIGADPQMRTGLQNPLPSHALGKIMQSHAAAEAFSITGTDWPTRDGSGLRDYIHVWDLALAHVAAVERFDEVATGDDPYRVINIGTGEGVTVRELVAAFERVTGEALAVVETARRPGDQAGAFAIVDRAAEVLDWRAERSVDDGVRDAITWAEKLPSIR